MGGAQEERVAGDAEVEEDVVGTVVGSEGFVGGERSVKGGGGAAEQGLADVVEVDVEA